MGPTKNPDAYLNYFKANSELLSAMGSNFPDPATFRSAIKLYDKAIEYDTSFAKAYARRAIALSWGIHYGEFDAAECEKCFSDIDKASKIDSKLPEVKIAWGFYHYYCKNDYDTAAQRFQEAFDSKHVDYEPLFYLMAVYRTWCRWRDMQKLLKRITKFDIHDPLVLTNIGISYDYLHKFNSAITYHDKAIHAEPGWLPAYLNKIYSHCFKDGNTIEYHAVLDFLTRNIPGNLKEVSIDLDIFDRKYPDALKKTLNAYTADFTFKAGRFMYLGKISLLMHDQSKANKYFDDALVELEQARCQNPNDPSILSLIGLALAGKRDPRGIEEGEKALKIAIKTDNCPLANEMRLNLAEIYTKLGKCVKATRQIEYLLKNRSYFSEKILMLDPVWEPWLKCPGSEKYITESPEKVLTSK